MTPEDPSDLALAITRVEQAGALCAARLRLMADDHGGYTRVPDAKALVDELHYLINHLLVARSALNRIQGRTSNAQQEQ
jgi:hypothetical protein